MMLNFKDRVYSRLNKEWGVGFITGINIGPKLHEVVFPFAPKEFKGKRLKISESNLILEAEVEESRKARLKELLKITSVKNGR